MYRFYDASSYFEIHKSVILKVEDLLESLSNKERRKLLTLIRSNNFIPKETLKGMLTHYGDRQVCDRKKLDDTVKIHKLYEKVNISETDYNHHWNYNHLDQKSKHHEMNVIAKPPRQDNKTYINRGGGHDNYNTIRYPSKKRKTAWKRFWKLFPHLKENKDN